MRKIISVFQRNYDTDRLIRDEVTPGAEWVLTGAGVATRKWDGTCCMVQGGILFKRYDAKKGKTPPQGFISAQDPDPVTGHWPGWLEVGGGPEDKWFREAAERTKNEDGTYELLGPRIQGNPERLQQHWLIRHGDEIVPGFPRTFGGMRDWFKNSPSIEGVVFWHPDGRMAKVKLKDFGIRRQEQEAVSNENF